MSAATARRARRRASSRRIDHSDPDADVPLRTLVDKPFCDGTHATIDFDGNPGELSALSLAHGDHHYRLSGATTAGGIRS
jgi:hypothetical protein